MSSKTTTQEVKHQKYENMSKKTLLNRLLKTEAKLDKLKQELSDKKDLVKFLRIKTKNNIDEKQYYTLENAPSMKNFKEEFEALPKDEQKNIRNEVYRECGLNADNN